jgi:hypothetical protein
MRAALRLGKGDYKGCLQDADAMLATGRGGEIRRRAHLYRAYALLKLGQPAQAFASVQIALEIRDPKARALASGLKREILQAVPDSGPRLPASARATLHIEPVSKAESLPPAPRTGASAP